MIRVMSPEGRGMTAFFEGREHEAYRDDGGVWTIGVGHTAGVREGMRWEDWQIDAAFTDDLHHAEDAVSAAIRVPLAQCQFDSLCDLAFNIGRSAFANSTLVRVLNARDYYDVPVQEARWVYDDGKVVQGLVNRRAAAIRLWKGLPWRT